MCISDKGNSQTHVHSERSFLKAAASRFATSSGIAALILAAGTLFSGFASAQVGLGHVKRCRDKVALATRCDYAWIAAMSGWMQ
jgi:hypothetical protein